VGSCEELTHIPPGYCTITSQSPETSHTAGMSESSRMSPLSPGIWSFGVWGLLSLEALGFQASIRTWS
jgi:hypothetical protein